MTPNQLSCPICRDHDHDEETCRKLRDAMLAIRRFRDLEEPHQEYIFKQTGRRYEP